MACLFHVIRGGSQPAYGESGDHAKEAVDRSTTEVQEIHAKEKSEQERILNGSQA